MHKCLYVMMMINRNPLDFGVIQRHVEHLKEMDRSGKLTLCGPFTDFGGGMVILDVPSIEEADMIAKADPYVLEGYKSYEIRTLEWANADNNYLLD